ncbi:MAG: shikimate dehydrogenase [Pseudomonadota bacterium]
MTAVKYAVIGNPVSHSKSPQIHTAFAQQEGIEIEYQRILADDSNFIDSIDEFRSTGGLGLNVTLPFKVTAFEHCRNLNEYAKAAYSVNTIRFDDQGQWIGSNTDGLGLLQDLTANLHLQLSNKMILVLGAGGSTRGIVYPLLKQRPAKLVIVNRNLEKAKVLTEIFRSQGKVTACTYDDLGEDVFDLVINATSASIDNSVPPIPANIVGPDTTCYDLYYSDSATSFIGWSQDKGVKACADGLGMLIEQAAESYYIWRGYRPETKSVYSLLRPEGSFS